jgi:hypothetical protein
MQLQPDPCLDSTMVELGDLPGLLHAYNKISVFSARSTIKKKCI